jgi:hypothetical protein
MSDEFEVVEKQTTAELQREMDAMMENCPNPRYGLVLVFESVRRSWIRPAVEHLAAEYPDARAELVCRLMRCLLRAANSIGRRHGIQFQSSGEIGEVWCPDCERQWSEAPRFSLGEPTKHH